MSVEDPFFVVRGEVEKSVNKCRELQHQWREMLNDNSTVKGDNYDHVSNDLRNGIRSIEWDLEDLDETIGIVESNPRKFHINNEELVNRKTFISNTRKYIQSMKDELNDPENRAKADKVLKNNLLQNGLTHQNKNGLNNYSKFKIVNENSSFIDDQQQQQRLMIEQQDDQLDLVADSVGILKNMSKAIGNELDDQAVMLDDLGNEMENTQNRMDTILKKMAKVTHLSNDKRQWCAIGVLGSSIFVIFLLLLV